MVEYQNGSSDISQSNAAKVMVSAEEGQRARSRSGASAGWARVRPSSSCCSDQPRSSWFTTTQIDEVDRPPG